MVQNSKGILDSLTRFEFLKQQVRQYQTDIQTCEVQKISVRSQLAISARKLAVCEAQAIDYKVVKIRHRNSRLENWFWRIGVGIGTYYLARSKLP